MAHPKSKHTKRQSKNASSRSRSKTSPRTEEVSDHTSIQKEVDMTDETRSGAEISTLSSTRSSEVSKMVAAYEKEQKVLKLMWDDKDERSKLEDYVRTSLFSRVKFITGDKMMKVDGRIAMLVFKDLHIPDSLQQAYWDKHKSALRKAINQKRANITNEMKKEFVKGKLAAY